MSNENQRYRRKYGESHTVFVNHLRMALGLGVLPSSAPPKEVWVPYIYSRDTRWIKAKTRPW